MDKADVAQPEDDSDNEAAYQNDTNEAGTCPTFLDRTHQCVSNIWITFAL